jgi:hypothetical protein
MQSLVGTHGILLSEAYRSPTAPVKLFARKTIPAVLA